MYQKTKFVMDNQRNENKCDWAKFFSTMLPNFDEFEGSELLDLLKELQDIVQKAAYGDPQHNVKRPRNKDEENKVLPCQIQLLEVIDKFKSSHQIQVNEDTQEEKSMEYAFNSETYSSDGDCQIIDDNFSTVQTKQETKELDLGCCIVDSTESPTESDMKIEEKPRNINKNETVIEKLDCHSTKKEAVSVKPQANVTAEQFPISNPSGSMHSQRQQISAHNSQYVSQPSILHVHGIPTPQVMQTQFVNSNANFGYCAPASNAQMFTQPRSHLPGPMPQYYVDQSVQIFPIQPTYNQPLLSNAPAIHSSYGALPQFTGVLPVNSYNNNYVHPSAIPVNRMYPLNQYAAQHSISNQTTPETSVMEHSTITWSNQCKYYQGREGSSLVIAVPDGNQTSQAESSEASAADQPASSIG